MQTTFALPMRSFRLNENQDTVALAAISFGLRRPAGGRPAATFLVGPVSDCERARVGVQSFLKFA
jgi:hypothetical protein